MLLDHTENYFTTVKLEFFQAKTEAESLRPYITYRLNFVATLLAGRISTHFPISERKIPATKRTIANILYY
jgi:hypothetical protein